MLRLLFLLTLAAMAWAGWLVWTHLGAWSLLVVPAALYVVLRLAGGWLLRQALMLPFRAKGAVLRRASATVHSVVRLPDPPVRERLPWAAADDGDGEGEEDLGDRRLYQLVATIAPQEEVRGPFRLWEPGGIRLSAPDVDPADDSADDGPCAVRGVEVEEDGAFVADDGRKYEGPRRVRLSLAVRPGAERLVFLYYLEKFGEVRLAG